MCHEKLDSDYLYLNLNWAALIIAFKKKYHSVNMDTEVIKMTVTTNMAVDR